MSLRILEATLEDGYRTAMRARSHAFAADEPSDVGGTDTAPTPVELVLGGLASCTTITLRMYAQRKGWALHGVDVQVHYTAKPTPTAIKHVTMHGPLDDAQRARLLEIADRCPVAQLLAPGMRMESRLGPQASAAPAVPHRGSVPPLE